MSIADLSRDRQRLRISGVDRVDFLQGQCTNDVRKLRPGQSCYATFLNAKGKMRGDAYVVCLEDAFVLEASAGLAESLGKFIITEDVTIEDISESLGAWLVVGGAAEAARPEVLTFTHLLGLGVLSATPLPVTLDAGALEALRIEAGIPAWGIDLDENTIPVEAGLASRAIAYDKGCYIGQETIARIKTYGHVNRHLVQMASDGEALPGRGEKLFCREKEIGYITSAALSNRLGKTIAIGYVRRELASPGTILNAGGQSWEIIKLCGE